MIRLFLKNTVTPTHVFLIYTTTHVIAACKIFWLYFLVIVGRVPRSRIEVSFVFGKWASDRMNLNSCPGCHFPRGGETCDEYDRDQHHHNLDFAPNYYPKSSVSFHVFFNSNQDHLGFYDGSSLHPHHEMDNYSYNQSGSSAPEANDNVESDLKLTLWKNNDRTCEDQGMSNQTSDKSLKWMTPKMRVMHKMKNPEDRLPQTISNAPKAKPEPSTDHSSGYNSSYNNSPIRVCSDCNTTKTPLWRSGPKGPKSLCNACGIRQRKARRALAAATTGQPPETKIKVQHKEMKRKIKGQIKKPRKHTVSDGSSSTPNNKQKKLRFEDFLVNLSKKLSVHRVFPDDERNAAILLMAISSGLVHG